MGSGSWQESVVQGHVVRDGGSLEEQRPDDGTKGALVVDGYTGYNNVTDPDGRARGGAGRIGGVAFSRRVPPAIPPTSTTPCRSSATCSAWSMTPPSRRSSARPRTWRCVLHAANRSPQTAVYVNAPCPRIRLRRGLPALIPAGEPFSARLRGPESPGVPSDPHVVNKKQKKGVKGETSLASP